MFNQIDEKRLSINYNVKKLLALPFLYELP